MSLNKEQIKYLRRLSHPLRPVVMIGHKGLTTAVLSELEERLRHHELIKIRFGSCDRATRDRLVAQLLAGTGADPVRQIGFTLTLYRPNPEKRRITLPG